MPFPLILPGMAICGMAAAPFVAGAMASVFPNRLGDWVNEHLLFRQFEANENYEEPPENDGYAEDQRQEQGQGMAQRQSGIDARLHVSPPPSMAAPLKMPLPGGVPMPSGGLHSSANTSTPMTRAEELYLNRSFGAGSSSGTQPLRVQ